MIRVLFSLNYMNKFEIFFKLFNLYFLWFVIVLSVKNLNLILVGSYRVKYSLRIFDNHDIERVFEKRLNFEEILILLFVNKISGISLIKIPEEFLQKIKSITLNEAVIS